MKIEQLIVQHLYQKKQVSLQGIGIFRLKSNTNVSADADKESQLTPDLCTFEYSLKTGDDDSLVEYIVQQTGKIKPLASSDLESYAILATQFLNLGKPLMIEGIGTIQKNQKGEYEFSPGQYVNPKIDDIFKPITQRKEDEVSFESKNYVERNNKPLIWILIIAGSLVAGGLIYYLLDGKNIPVVNMAESANIKGSLKKDTTQITALKMDSIAKKNADSLHKIALSLPLHNADSVHFSIVLKNYTTQKTVEKAYKRLTNYGHKLQIIKVDSTFYKLSMSFIAPLADTLKKCDSLKKFFGGKPYVQL